MQKRQIFLWGAVVLLVTANLYTFSVNQSLKSDVNLGEDKLLGAKSGIVSLSGKYESLKSELDTIIEDGGKHLKENYDTDREKKMKLFEKYYQLNQDMVEAKLTNDDDRFSELKGQLSDIIDLGDYVQYDFFRGKDWTMVYYDSLPEIQMTVLETEVIGIVDGKGRTVAVLQLTYDSSTNRFQLISADTTYEWLEATEAYNFGQSEVGMVIEKERKSDEK